MYAGLLTCCFSSKIATNASLNRLGVVVLALIMSNEGQDQLNVCLLTATHLCVLTQEKDCASLYDVQTYVEPNEIEPSLVCMHHHTLPALNLCCPGQFSLHEDFLCCVCLCPLASEYSQGCVQLPG